ncbi:hypothetical protein [Streptomyces sp. NPDC058548]|uniref:hypothetical protein n=1 Tax=Streptomyces sp. NPDC058548 TaxID=3346545 RepID=UPI00365AAAC0
MITFHALGYWAFFALLAGLLIANIFPGGSAAHRRASRLTLAALLLIAATVALSY